MLNCLVVHKHMTDTVQALSADEIFESFEIVSLRKRFYGSKLRQSDATDRLI